MVKTVYLYGFPTVESPETVTKFLEEYTGEGTVLSVNFLPPKDGGASRSSATVQFTTAKCAEIILSLAEKKRLWYGESYLKAREWKHEMAPRSEVLEDLVALHFGCKIPEEKFSVLWTKSDVSVKFGMELKNMHLSFSYDGLKYKLELPSDIISRIELHCPCDQFTKFLLVQLRGAPRIYKKEVTLASDNHWVREVDFTPSCCIGQSSSLCLELPLRCALPDLGKSFIHYIENEGQFVLKRGNTFSGSSALVPILAPPPGIDLPYKILFKINSLVQHGCIPGQALDVDFYNLVDPTRIRIEYIVCALDELFNSKECCYEPGMWLLKQYIMYKACKRIPQSPAISLDEGFVYVHRVQITPSKVYFCGPEVNLSNRVLRNYPEDIDNFLRVSFVDEDLGKMRSVDLCPRTSSAEEERRTRVYERILSTLRDGIVIGDKKFEFLAYSSSQLRENSAWMFASRRGLTAQEIRDWMGDFSHIKNVAKYAARLGQSFSSSRETFTVGSDEIEVIPDVEIERGGTRYCFSDGIGKISAEFAERVARKCGKSSTPSAFQIRYGGYKGVVAVDPTLSKKLSLRKSMCKFESRNTKLDVLAWSKYQPCFLNRQLVTLLSTLGVKDHVFEKKQKQAMNQLEGILTDPLKAQEALELMFQGEASNILKEMLMCYKPNAEPFLSLMLQSLCASKHAELRSRTRIFVPNGRSLMGCLDETGTLEYGQVFVQCSHHAIFTGNTTSTASQDNFTVVGKVVVAKNPCLHPGDVRVLMAVDVPALRHMVDCVVFPQKGKRPHPNECSGSDLDGDVYFVSWDRDLIPPRITQPMNYTSAPIEELDHDVTMEEVEESFTNYIVNDSLGIISNAHLVFADREPQKAMSDKCIKLAKLHSHAVDSPKTGVIVKLPPKLRVHKYPDFMEKIDRPTYESKRVIGKLFRQVKDIELGSHSHSFKSFTREVACRFYDPDMEVDGFEDYINDAISYKREYDYKLGNLMDYYGIKTEAEILSGNITNVSKFFSKRKDLESINYAVRSLKNEARARFMKEPNSDDPSDFGTDIGNVYYAKASAWYHVTYHHRYWGCYNKGMARDHFLSFPWCVFEMLIQIKRHNTSKGSH
ncbi:putative RNA-dependent RNA polymerase 1 [Rosa sericea]